MQAKYVHILQLFKKYLYLCTITQKHLIMKGHSYLLESALQLLKSILGIWWQMGPFNKSKMFIKDSVITLVLSDKEAMLTIEELILSEVIVVFKNNNVIYLLY